MLPSDLQKRIPALLKNVFQSEPVAFAYLFGSYAGGHPDEESDIDIAVYADPELTKDKRFDLWMNLYAPIERALGYPTQKVDISMLQDTSTLLQINAISAKCVLFERDRLERILYEWKIRRRYDDEEYQRTRREEYTLRRILELPTLA